MAAGKEEKAAAFEMDFSHFGLSEEQKFLFDLKGYLVIPDVFNPDEVAAMKEQVYKIKHAPHTLLPEERTVPGGASEAILTNPIVKGTLNTLIGPDVRFDTHHVIWREQGQRDGLPPHQGGPARNPHFHYHVTGGHIYSALTVIVVELNPVGIGDGGTMFLPGSHKSAFPVPQTFKVAEGNNYEAHFDRYAASPGSIVVFSEGTCHAGPVWRNPDHPRVSIFMWFNHVGSRWHRHHVVAPEVLAGLGAEARWYFRDVWSWDHSGPLRKEYDGKNVVLTHPDGTLTVSP